MKIATWNVNGIRAVFKKGFTDFVHKVNPDVLCLQETKVHPDQLKDFQKNLYPCEYWSVCGRKKGYSGTAVFSKKPALNIWKGMEIKKFDWEGRIIAFEDQNFVLISVYFPNGALTRERHLFKQEFLRRFPWFLTELRKKTEKELIIVGDYNVAYKDIDVYSPKTLQNTSGFLPEERKWFEEFLEQGYMDVYRYFYPDKKNIYTWWSLRQKARKLNHGWRIDHICTTKNLKSRLQSIQIYDQQEGSDHCPVLLEISNGLG